jgi:PDZ domain-containing protein
MTQRNLAAVLAAPLLIGLWVVVLTQPLPYVTYKPGVTVDVLGDPDGEEIIQVSGHPTYRDDGQLRMTTVFVSRPKPATVNLFQLMQAWVSKDDAVYPYDAVYTEGTTQKSSEAEGRAEMASSQDLAVAAALGELGSRVVEFAVVATVLDGQPAAGVLQAGDEIAAVNGEKIDGASAVGEAVAATPAGEDVELDIVRKGEKQTVRITPVEQDGKPYIGIELTSRFTFPFDVSLHIDPDIGGPSAGLMFSLGIYDTLTPGSMTDGKVIAGTGTIDADERVGPIGGIQQKIAGAREAGAKLFMVPPDNCDEAVDAQNGDMTLVRADTMHDAVAAIESWVDDPDATLPSCEKEAS